MEKWQVTALILCGFGFFKEFRPSENYLTDYLVDFKELSLDSLVHVAFPVFTYSYLATLFLVFLLTDFLRYRVVIVVEGIAFVATYALLLWGNGLTSFIIVEVIFGVTQSTEVAYYTYIYAKVDKEHYKRVTSYTYTAIFTGRFFAAIVGQALVSLQWADYHELHYITLGSVSVALFLVLFLPKVTDSIYFHRHHDSVKGDEVASKSSETPISTSDNNGFGTFETPTAHELRSPEKVSLRNKIRSSLPILWLHFTTAYSNAYVLKWSVWWSLGLAGHLQVTNYIQALWTVTAEEGGGSAHYNAGADAILCALSVLGALAVGHVNISWKTWSDLSITVISALMSCFLVYISRTTDMIGSYTGYVLFRLLFQVNLTIASAEISQQILEDSHGLVFGLNTFSALVVQTILTVVTTDQSGLALSERSQFLVIGVGFGVLATGFLLVAVAHLVQYLRKTSSNIHLVSADSI